MSATVPAADFTRVVLANGHWYAFRFEGREFYAVTYNNPLSGHLELIEIPDPYASAGRSREKDAADAGH